jgi:hypothetical protein
MQFKQFREFEQFVYGFFKIDQSMKLAASYETQVVNKGGATSIEVLDSGRRIGFINFEPVEDVIGDDLRDCLDVDLMAVDQDYQKDPSVFMTLIREFKNFYNQNYKDWPITTNFYNAELSNWFQKQMDRGVFPKDSMVQTQNMSKEDFDEFADDVNKSYFPQSSVNQQVAKVKKKRLIRE